MDAQFRSGAAVVRLKLADGRPHASVQLSHRIGIHEIELYVFVAPTLARGCIRLPEQIELEPLLCSLTVRCRSRSRGLRFCGWFGIGGPALSRLALAALAQARGNEQECESNPQ